MPTSPLTRALPGGLRRWLAPAAGLALLLAGTPGANAQTLYGIGQLSQNLAPGASVFFPAGGNAGDQGILPIDIAAGTPAGLAVPITGVTAGYRIVGSDFRPNTGELFALAYNATTAGVNSQLYIIVPTTGAATAVGSPVRLELGGANERIAFDFNPTVDRIRVEGTNGRNYRLNPNNSAIAATDGNLAYAPGTPNAGTPARIGAAAYLNSFRASSNTTLYAIDEVNSLLATQSPPNDGVLINQLPLTTNGAGFGTALALDVDASFFTTPGTNEVLLIEVTAANASGLSSSNLYTLDLATGNANNRRNVIPAFAGTPFNIFDIAVSIPAPAALAPVAGQLVYGVTASNQFISFDSQNPGTIRTVAGISGIATGQTLVGTDFRPNTGQLFGLGYDATTAGVNSEVYTINPMTGAATSVGAAIRLELGGPGEQIVFDFNPTVDRIRVEGTNDNNYRLNPNNGALAATDGTLAYAGTLAGTNPTVGSAAYSNSFVGTTATGLYTVDHALGVFAQQNPANAGTLTNPRNLTGVNGAGVGGAIAPTNDLDIYYNGTTNVTYLAAAAAATPNSSRFFQLGPLMGAGDQVATDQGQIGLGISVRDISVQLAPASTVAMNPGAVTGQLVYAVAGGSLISFDSNNPGVIRSAVNVTGLTMGQSVAGLDFRPANGDLVAFGYNPTTEFGEIYSLDLTTGALTSAGPALNYGLGNVLSNIGFDFNPTVDRIRIVSATNQANRRANPNDGTFLVDGNLTNSTNGTTPALSGVAYANNDNNANTGTTLYGYDQARNVLLRSTNANGGVYVDQGSSGIAVNDAQGVDLDIFSDLTNAAMPANSAFLAAAPLGSTADNFYSVSLATGAATLLGQVGQGSNLSGTAVFLTPGAVVPLTALTWNGSVSTAWGLAANWTPNQVPTITDNVLIPGGTPNQPTVSNAQSANTITLNNGAVLSLVTGGILTSGGSFVNNGGSVAGGGSGTIVFNGITPAPTIGGSSVSNFPNLTISTPAASTNGPVGIMQTLNLNGTLTIGTSQAFTLMSTATTTAYVVNNAGGVLAGTATVQRYIDPSRNTGLGYRHYSSPVSGNTVADLTAPGYVPVLNAAYNTSATPGTVTPFPNVFGYDQTRVGNVASNYNLFDQGYFSPTATTDALETARGYTVNLNASVLVDFVGTANNGAISVTGLGRGTTAQSGWHLRGNPYPSPLDWQAMINAGRLTGLENALYVFKSSGQYTGSYASYIAGVGTNGGTNVLPLAQGFFVRTATGQTGSIAFTNQERLISDPGTPFQRNTADTRPLLTLALAGATATTQAAIYFDANATAGFDAANDAVALPAPNGLTLATAAGAELLAINGQAPLTGADVLLPLHVAATTAGTYALTVDALANLPAGYRAYLRDAVTGTYTDLAATATVPVSLAANAPAAGRYALLFTTQARVLATAPAALAALASVYPNPAHGTATLLLPQALRGAQATQVQIVDNLGRVVRTLSAGAAAALELPLGGLAPGIYSVQALTTAGRVSKRLIVE